MNKPQYLIVHHFGPAAGDPFSDTSHHTVQIVDAHHKTRWPNFKSSLGWYVGYHYVIEKDGKVTQTRKDTEEGAHTIGLNNSSIGIALAGNFDAFLPTDKQIKALRSLLNILQTRHNIPLQNILPHRKFASKSCFGSRLSDDWARQVAVSTPPVAPVPPPTADIEKLKLQISALKQLILLYTKLIDLMRKKKYGRMGELTMEGYLAGEKVLTCSGYVNNN